MASLNNLPIGTRLGAGFGVVILGIAGVGAAAFLSLNSVKAEYGKLS